MQVAELRDRLTAVVGAVLAEAGVDLEAVTVQPAGRRRVVRVTVDRDDGITSDKLAEVSQVVSRALDDADTMGSAAYTLEVSTPGVDRPLTEPRHWRRARGRLVRAALRRDGEDAGEVRGRVVTADEHGAVLEHDGAQHRYSYEDLGDGRVEVELRRSAADAASGDEPDAGEDVR